MSLERDLYCIIKSYIESLPIKYGTHVVSKAIKFKLVVTYFLK